MAAPGNLPPYGFIRLVGTGRYLALGPGGPVLSVQAVAGIRRGIRAQLQRERDAGVEIEPNEEQTRLEERMRALGGTLSQAQHDRLRDRVFSPERDASHPEWFIASTMDPNVAALWIATIRDNMRVWVTAHGPLRSAGDDSPTGPYDYAPSQGFTGWRTLGIPRRSIAVARELRQPGRLRELLDPDALQQFWAIDRYTVRWQR